MSNKFEDLFNTLENDIKSKMSGTKVYWGENDLNSGIRLVLEFLGLNKQKLEFNLKVCGSQCFTVKQSAQLAELEDKIQNDLPFNQPGVQKGKRNQVQGGEYYLIASDEIADREKKQTVDYTRKFRLTLTMKG